MKSRRPYLIRAVYDWAADNGYTPHLLIAADAVGVIVPREYVSERAGVLCPAPHPHRRA